MTLEQQLKALADLGMPLDEGITVGDLLYSFPREEYERKPFDLLLFVMGSEVERRPWGRAVCSRVWNFYAECITETGDYVAIVRRLCRVANMPNAITHLEDFVDIETGQAWLKYKVDGVQRNRAVEVRNDWADGMTISYVMADLERHGFRFYFKDNGQAMILFYLDAPTARKLNRLSQGALTPVLPE